MKTDWSECPRKCGTHPLLVMITLSSLLHFVIYSCNHSPSCFVNFQRSCASDRQESGRKFCKDLSTFVYKNLVGKTCAACQIFDYQLFRHPLPRPSSAEGVNRYPTLDNPSCDPRNFRDSKY